MPPVCWGPPCFQHGPEQQPWPHPSHPEAVSCNGKLLSALGLVCLFLPLLLEPDVASAAVMLGAGRGSCHPLQPTMRVPVCLSICLSVPIWQRAAAPLPVVCSSCLSKAFPSPPRSSRRFLGMARCTLLARPHLAGAGGRQGEESRQERRALAATRWGNRLGLEFSCPNNSKLALFGKRLRWL